MKQFGIGYTIFEFEGTHKRPMTMVKGTPGNIQHELKKLEHSIKKMNQHPKVIEFTGLCMGAFMWGYSVRGLMAL